MFCAAIAHISKRRFFVAFSSFSFIIIRVVSTRLWCDCCLPSMLMMRYWRTVQWPERVKFAFSLVGSALPSTSKSVSNVCVRSSLVYVNVCACVCVRFGQRERVCSQNMKLYSFCIQNIILIFAIFHTISRDPQSLRMLESNVGPFIFVLKFSS